MARKRLNREVIPIDEEEDEEEEGYEDEENYEPIPKKKLPPMPKPPKENSQSEIGFDDLSVSAKLKLIYQAVSR